MRTVEQRIERLEADGWMSYLHHIAWGCLIGYLLCKSSGHNARLDKLDPPRVEGKP